MGIRVVKPIVAVVAAVILVLCHYFYWSHGHIGRAAPAQESYELMVEPNTLDLGNLPPGLSLGNVKLRNRSSTQFIVRWTSSCECVRIEPPITEIEAGVECSIPICLDVDEAMRGSYRIEIAGKTPAEREIAKFVVRFQASATNAAKNRTNSDYPLAAHLRILPHP